MRSLLDDILSADESIQCVGIIDSDENTLSSRTKDNSLRIISESNEEVYAFYLKEMKHMQETFDNCLGTISQMQFVREKSHHFVYFFRSKIIYVICDVITDFEKLFKLSNAIKFKIDKTYSSLLYRLPYD